MRQVILNPHENDLPDSEQFLGVTTASRAEYRDLEDFITHSGDHFPFNKIDSPQLGTACSSEILLRFIAPIREAYPQEGLPLPAGDGFMYADDWDYKDYAFATDDRFVRIVWTITA
jgi:hypothetical protein